MSPTRKTCRACRDVTWRVKWIYTRVIRHNLQHVRCTGRHLNSWLLFSSRCWMGVVIVMIDACDWQVWAIRAQTSSCEHRHSVPTTSHRSRQSRFYGSPGKHCKTWHSSSSSLQPSSHLSLASYHSIPKKKSLVRRPHAISGDVVWSRLSKQVSNKSD